MKAMVLLDRDGTINVEKHYLAEPDQVELLPGVGEGIRLLRRLGLRVVVVTNQSGVGRGYFSLQRLEAVHQRLRELLEQDQAVIDAIYVCPHPPEADCACRKPAPGLAQRAAAEFGASLADSFMVGDKPCDIDLGKRLGATTILVRTGYGQRFLNDGAIEPDHVAADLREAACLIEQLLGQRVPAPQ
jgi:D-glycero-D-manno-heptose 1,7-bisphosphate phosphatase